MSEFADYCFCSTWDGDGEIYNQDGKIVWRFQTTGVRRPSIFSFRDEEGCELATIRRENRFPMARFATFLKDAHAGIISQRNIWRTKFEFEFEGKPKWSLCLPLFSICGKAVSADGEQILIQAPNRRQWFMRIKAGLEFPALVAGLAFVVRKKLQDK